MNVWVENSLRVVIPTNEVASLYLSVAVGILILGHSYYLHNKKWTKVRIANDVAAVSVISESLCFLRCSIRECTKRQQVLFNNFLANAIFGASVQIADNFMTFSRYSVVSGGASSRHKVFAFVWVFVTLYASWWEFFTIFPFFFDMNSTEWLQPISVLSYFTLSSYVAFDLFYFLLLLPFLVKADSRMLPSSQSQHEPIYRVFSAKAAGHTLLSMAGICVYTFNFPAGIMQQNLITVVGIHIFLNWSNSHLLVYEWIARCKTYSKRTQLKVYASNLVVVYPENNKDLEAQQNNADVTYGQH